MTCSAQSLIRIDIGNVDAETQSFVMVEISPKAPDAKQEQIAIIIKIVDLQSDILIRLTKNYQK